MDECINSLDEAQVFTALDAKGGYWQISIIDKSQTYDDIYNTFRTYIFKRASFGLKECSLDVSTSDRRYPHDREVIARLILFERCYRLPADFR